MAEGGLALENAPQGTKDTSATGGGGVPGEAGGNAGNTDGARRRSRSPATVVARRPAGLAMKAMKSGAKAMAKALQQFLDKCLRGVLQDKKLPFGFAVDANDGGLRAHSIPR